MRLIAQLPDGALAIRFGDYLTATGVTNLVEQGAKGFSVWVHDDDHVDRAKRELDAYLVNPLAPQYQQANDVAARVRAEQDTREKKLRRNYVDVRTSWAKTSAGGFTPLTMFLIVASCAATLLTGFGKESSARFLWIDSSYEPTGVRDGVAVFEFKQPPAFLRDVRRGQVWRLVSPIALHMSPMHLLFNMWWLWGLGRMVERRKGIGWLALVVFSTALASNLVQYWWSGPYFGGMSGVVYALFGYVWMKGKFQPQENMGVSQQTVTIMLVWLVACMTGFLGPIANAAHVVGLLGGMALGHASHSWKNVRKALRKE